jgi:spore germination cell wall hydrolase CwlJ-like protein
MHPNSAKETCINAPIITEREMALENPTQEEISAIAEAVYGESVTEEHRG